MKQYIVIRENSYIDTLAIERTFDEFADAWAFCELMKKSEASEHIHYYVTTVIKEGEK